MAMTTVIVTLSRAQESIVYGIPPQFLCVCVCVALGNLSSGIWGVILTDNSL